MIVSISSDAEADLAEGYWFYERVRTPRNGENVMARSPKTSCQRPLESRNQRNKQPTI